MTDKLYELTDQYKWLEKVLDEAEEELPKDALDAIKTKIEDKAEDIAKLVRSYEVGSESIQAEIDRLAKRSKSLANKAIWLKGYLQQEMQVAGIEKIKRDLFTISLRPCPPSVNITNLDLIPLPFRRVIPETWQPDKKAILDLYKEKDGEVVIPGVEIISDKKSLTIR
jgi:hypothetical protein